MSFSYNAFMRDSSFLGPERGSGFLMILTAIVLFAALSYAISRQSGGTKGLSEERQKLGASEIIDAGTRFADTVSRLRLKGISSTGISFENTVVSGYTNGGCSSDSCKVFAFDGGGLDWEMPVAGVNGGEDWGFSGSVSLTDAGTSDPDLLAVFPDISLDVCSRLNVLLGLHDAVTSPPLIPAATFDKFTGTYSALSTINAPLINGKKSGCLQITTGDGTAIAGAPLTGKYYFIQVLQAF